MFALDSPNWEHTASHPEVKRRIFSSISPTGTWKHAVAQFASVLTAKKTTLTFKGEIQEDPRFKKRQELETSVDDPQAIIKVLEALGMYICFEYSKIREIYTLSVDQDQAEICLDETPVGTFVEIEGSENTIEALASQLGWTPDSFIRRNYVEMYLEARSNL